LFACSSGVTVSSGERRSDAVKQNSLGGLLATNPQRSVEIFPFRDANIDGRWRHTLFDRSTLSRPPRTPLQSRSAALAFVLLVAPSPAFARTPLTIEDVFRPAAYAEPTLSDDFRTPMEQTRKMVRALERADNPPKAVIIKSGEGHGYGKTENNVDLYNQIFEFLDTNIGTKSKR
jgi:hypothetical protein